MNKNNRLNSKLELLEGSSYCRTQYTTIGDCSMSLYKSVIRDLKNRVREVSFLDISKNDVIRKLKSIYYDNITNTNITYETYMEVTVYLVILKALQTTYQIH